MIRKITTSTGKVIFINTERQTMIELPKGSGYLGKNGIVYPVFDSIKSFVESGEKQAVIYMYCSSKERIRKRFKFGFELKFGKLEMFNCEHSKIGWINHNVEEIYPDRAYIVLVERNLHCVNDVFIKYCKEIKKPEA